MTSPPSPTLTPRMRRARRRQRGVAFVMVLGALTILTVMLTEVQDESSAEFSSALSARDALAAEYAARSAVNLSRLLIAAEPTIRGAVGPLLAMLYGGQVPQIPVWEFSESVLGAFNDSVGVETFATFSGLDLSRGRNLGLPGASFEIKVVDEDSKINVNAASRESFSRQRLMQQLFALMSGPQFDPLFERRDPDGNFSDRQAICSAIIDWADFDQETMLCDPTVITAQEMPAEDSYYQLLERRYQRKNAPYDSLEELRMVRGIGDDFWATFVDPDPESPDRRVLTVWGSSGAVNVNTAAPQTLLALVCSLAVDGTQLCNDPIEMQKFLMIVTLARGFTAGAPAFSSPQAFVSTLQGKGLLGPLLMEAGLQPVQLKSPDEAKKQLTTESKVFSLYAVGKVQAGKRETRVHLHVVVDYRNAPPPTEAPPAGQNPASPLPNQPDPESPDPSSGTGLERALVPNAAGNVLYFKLD